MAGVRPQTWPKASLHRGGRRDDAVRNERLEPASRGLSIAAEDLQQRFDVEKRWRRPAAHHQAVAAPRPVDGVCAKAGAYRVQRDVPNDFEEIRIRGDGRRAVTRAEDVTAIALDRVERRAVDTVQPLHSAG